MSEMTWTSMHIGGPVPSNKLNELLEAIQQDFGDDDDRPSSVGQLKAWARRRESVHVSGHVNYGSPDNVTAFCQEHGLTYWLHYEARSGQWDAGIQIWRPGLDDIEECGADSDSYAASANIHVLRTFATGGKTLPQVIEYLSRFDSDLVPPLSITKPALTEDELALAQSIGA